MAEHMQLRDMPKFCAEIEAWLNARYGEAEGKKRWEATGRQYGEYLKELSLTTVEKRPAMPSQSTAASRSSPCTLCCRTIRRQRNCRSLSRAFLCRDL